MTLGIKNSINIIQYLVESKQNESHGKQNIKTQRQYRGIGSFGYRKYDFFKNV